MDLVLRRKQVPFAVSKTSMKRCFWSRLFPGYQWFKWRCEPSSPWSVVKSSGFLIVIPCKNLMSFHQQLGLATKKTPLDSMFLWGQTKLCSNRIAELRKADCHKPSVRPPESSSSRAAQGTGSHEKQHTACHNILYYLLIVSYIYTKLLMSSYMCIIYLTLPMVGNHWKYLYKYIILWFHL